MDLGGRGLVVRVSKAYHFIVYLKGFGGEEDGLSCNIRNEPMI